MTPTTIAASQTTATETSLNPVAVVRGLGQQRFLRNAFSLGSAQLANRVLRLMTTLIVARVLMPHDYGLAAIVLTAHELVFMLGRHGLVAAIVQADQRHLKPISHAAHGLGWALGGVLFAIEAAAAWALAVAFDNPELMLPLGLLATTHLLTPLALVPAALTLRANRLGVTARIEVQQGAADVLLTVSLALAGAGFWALVLPKLLVMPIWVVGYRRATPWQRCMPASRYYWGRLLRFAAPVTGVEILTTLRNYGDYMLVGLVLGVPALGVYYFAFNAGLGISLSLIGALASALFPHLCAADPSQLEQRYRRCLTTIAVITVPLIVLQATLAPWYLPLVFGQRWVEAGALPVLMLICLSAIPRAFAEAGAQLLRAAGLPHLELKANAWLTAALLLALPLGLPWGVVGVALVVLVVHLLLLPWFTVWAARQVFAQKSHRELTTTTTKKGT